MSPLLGPPQWCVLSIVRLLTLAIPSLFLQRRLLPTRSAPAQEGGLLPSPPPTKWSPMWPRTWNTSCRSRAEAPCSRCLLRAFSAEFQVIGALSLFPLSKWSAARWPWSPLALGALQSAVHLLCNPEKEGSSEGSRLLPCRHNVFDPGDYLCSAAWFCRVLLRAVHVHKACRWEE